MNRYYIHCSQKIWKLDAIIRNISLRQEYLIEMYGFKYGHQDKRIDKEYALVLECPAHILEKFKNQPKITKLSIIIYLAV